MCVCAADGVENEMMYVYTYIPQFNMAKTIPGKEEFHETIRYFNKQLKLTDVAVRLNTRVSAQVKRPLLAYA